MASLLSKAAGALKPPVARPVPIPSEVEERIKNGRNRLRHVATRNNLCLRFWRGDQYVYIDSRGYLQAQGTVSNPDGSGKPRHRSRQVRNLILDHVENEVAAAIQRVPSYDVIPSSSDPRKIEAAHLSQKIALHVHDKAGVQNAAEDCVRYAVITGEGFAWPYWDAYRGTPIPGTDVCTGEVGIRTFGPNEVMWEPGIRFDDSRWFAIDQAMPIDEVESMEGYLGGKLTPDANTSDLYSPEKDKRSAKLVMVCRYLERPSPKTPEGRWVTMASGRVICEERPYPCMDGRGLVCDEPVLHKLSYIRDPDSDRDMGLVQHLIDPQRTYNDTNNKAIEAKNLALVLQVFALPGAIRTKLNDEPGAVFEVTDLNAIKFRDPPSPELFMQLRSIAQDTKADMALIASRAMPMSGDSGKGFEARVDEAGDRQSTFHAQLARFYSRLMVHCLYLVQRHYAEDRKIQIIGQFGPDTLDSFNGADLMDETSVRVNPASITPQTREGIEAKVNFYMQQGWVPPDKGIMAIQTGQAETIVQSYELQVAQQQREIRKMMALGQTMHPMASQEDFAQADVIEARPWQNHAVHMQVCQDFMATSDYENASPAAQEAILHHYMQHKALQQQAAMEQVQVQSAQAEQLGMQNAARPASPPNLPNMPGPPRSPAPESGHPNR